MCAVTDELVAKSLKENIADLIARADSATRPVESSSSVFIAIKGEWVYNYVVAIAKKYKGVSI